MSVPPGRGGFHRGLQAGARCPRAPRSVASPRGGFRRNLVAISSLHSRSVSLSGQLIVTFVVLVAATVAGLTIVADRSSLENLEAQALTAARSAAQTRNQLLSQLLALRL